MPEYKVRLEVSRSGHPAEVREAQITSDFVPKSGSLDPLAIELAAEFQKAIRFHEYLREVPDSDIPFVDARPITFDMTEGISKWHDASNTQSLWLEIHNNFGDIRLQLAQARAYKSLEPKEDRSNSESEEKRYYCHFAKMRHLNLAVFGLLKIQDLVVRLLFENYSATLIPVDQADEDWERELTFKKAKKGLLAEVNAGMLATADYDQIVAALNLIEIKSPERDKVIAYRNRLVHRLRPSVDYPQLFTPVEDRLGEIVKDANSNETGRSYGLGKLPTRPEYEFADLYSALLHYLKHVIDMLTRLKKIPRLG
jgi:hypothetical protein